MLFLTGILWIKCRFSVVARLLRIQVFQGAFVLPKYKREREMIIFACRHHIYELVLKGVFETKIFQVKTSDIPFFKKIRENWENVDIERIQNYSEKLSCLND